MTRSKTKAASSLLTRSSSVTQTRPRATAATKKVRGKRRRAKITSDQGGAKRQKFATTSYMPFSPSSSVKSKCCSLASMPIFNQQGESIGIDTQCYSLKDIMKHLQLSYKNIAKRLREKGHVQLNDHLATVCVKKILCGLGVEFEALTACQVPHLKELANLYSNSTQKPDVALYTNGKKKVVVTIEVQSSPIMKETECKTVLGATDLLRMLRCSQPSLRELSSFCFPNAQSVQCIIEVRVVWQNLVVEFHITRFKTIIDGVERLKEVFKNQCETLPDIPDHPRRDMLMPLADEDYSFFEGHGFSQLPSPTHIIVENKQSVVKVLHCQSEVLNIRDVIHIFGESPPKCSVQLQRFLSSTSEHLFCYTYPYLPHPKLNFEEAKKCLAEFLQLSALALEELHGMGICHNDVRLDNICFNREFKPVLIDFDKSTAMKGHFYRQVFTGSTSCMYLWDATRGWCGNKTDFMQLGWVTAWVLNPTQDYHRRDFLTQPLCITSNAFISKLILEGQFDKTLISNLPKDTLTVKAVLQGRN